MFLQASVILFTGGGVSQYALEQTSPPATIGMHSCTNIFSSFEFYENQVPRISLMTL